MYNHLEASRLLVLIQESAALLQAINALPAAQSVGSTKNDAHDYIGLPVPPESISHNKTALRNGTFDFSLSFLYCHTCWSRTTGPLPLCRLVWSDKTNRIYFSLETILDLLVLVFFLHIFVMFRVCRIILTKKYSQGSSWNALPGTKKNEEGERGRRRAVCAWIQEVLAAAAA